MFFVRTLIVLTVICLICLGEAAHATVAIYSGSVDIITTSGRLCNGVNGKHQITMVVKNKTNGQLSGFFEGEGISLGKLSGSNPLQLAVNYPYHDQLRATGHSLSLNIAGTLLKAELHDRHLADTAEDCNFDLARMDLKYMPEPDADAAYGKMSARFDAQLLRSDSLAFSRTGDYLAAVTSYERAYKLAETVYQDGSDQLIQFIVGLAGTYVKAGRYDDFTTLYDKRFASLHDDASRAVLNGLRVRALVTTGRKALNRDDYDGALQLFLPAYTLQPLGKDIIAAVMTAYARSGRYSDAFVFLEQAEKKFENQLDRKDIRGAMAMILLKKSRTDDRDGKSAEAELSLKRAMALDPDTVHYIVALARLRHKAGNLQEAEDLLDQGNARFRDEESRITITNARDKMRQTEMILKKIQKAGG